MTRFSIAIAASVLLAAPVALAQGYTPSTDAGKPMAEPHRSSESGLPSNSPQVESLDRATSGSSGSTAMPGYDRMGSDRMNSGQMNSGQMNGALANRGMSGSTGRMDSDRTMGTTQPQAMDSPGMNGSMMQVDRSDIASRRGPGQNNLELMQTSLLNQFSAAGFRAVRDFHKEGDRYIASALDPHGNWITVQMDPNTGAINAIR